MKIEFNTANTAELAAVTALIDSLTGRDSSLIISGENIDLPPVIGAGEQIAEPVAPLAPPPPPPVVATPPVAPPPPVGAIASAAPSPAPAGVDVDADGLPYDARIHSNPPSKKKDGKWRGKRGLDDATRDAVTAELKAAMAAPPAGSPPSPLPVTEPPADAATAFAGADAGNAASVAPPPPPPVAPPPPPVAAVAPPPPVVAEPAAPAAPPIAPPGEAVATTDFPSLMRRVTALQTAGKLTVQDTTGIAQSLGLSGLRDLMARPDLIDSFAALLPADEA